MSKIVAIVPCRNSAWILGLTGRVLFQYCDAVVFLDHASTDATHSIMSQIREEFPGRVATIRKTDLIWAEMSHRDTLLNIAREEFSPTHLVITDDDELPSGNILPRMRQLIEQAPRGAVLQLPWVQLKGSINTYISSGMWAQQCASTAFPDDPAYHWAARGTYDHHHRHPMGKPLAWHMPMGRGVNGGGCLHAQMASDQRLKWKQLLYKITERKRWPERMTPAQLNAMYDPTVIDKGVLSKVPDEWFAPYAHLMHHLHLDAEPWQRAEAMRLVAEDAKLLNGLTTYGLEI